MCVFPDFSSILLLLPRPPASVALSASGLGGTRRPAPPPHLHLHLHLRLRCAALHCPFRPIRCVSPPRPRTSGTSTSSTRCAREAMTRSESAGSCKVQRHRACARELRGSGDLGRGGGGGPGRVVRLGGGPKVRPLCVSRGKDKRRVQTRLAPVLFSVVRSGDGRVRQEGRQGWGWMA